MIIYYYNLDPLERSEIMLEYTQRFINGDDEVAPLNDPEKEVVNVANKMAKQRWELVAVCPTGNLSLIAYFKRKKYVRK